jgi:signal transduction histidine kinase
MTTARVRVVVMAALLCAAGAVALVLTSDREDADLAWAVCGPLVILSFVGTGLYAWRQRPESRIGELLVLLGFAWGVAALAFANSPFLFTIALVFGGLWGGLFLHLIMTFPTGRAATRTDRAIVVAGYVLFTVGSVPALLFAGPQELSCDDCADNLLQITHDESLATALLTLQTVLYVALFVVVLVVLTLRWRRADTIDRMQRTPIYACALLAFLLVTADNAGAGEFFPWAAFVATALLPFAFLAGLLRTHVARLDAELMTRLDELRSSRARLVEAGDAERRRLERDLHDGAQSRLVSVTMLLGRVRLLVDDDEDAKALLDRAQSELRIGLAELRELARGIHPAVLTERGLEPAISALATRASVPVTVDVVRERLPAPVEIAVYFVVSEALTNVAKYAQATAAAVTVRETDGRVTVEIADDGVGGADAARGSGLSGLTDRVAALDGTLSVDSPAGGGTRVSVDIPCAPVGAPA